MTDALSTGDFTAIDTETTGLSCAKCRIIEVGAVKFRNWQPVAVFSKLIKPGGHIPYYITELTGISDSMVEDSPSFPEISDELAAFFDSDDIVGHNLTFDLNFLSSEGFPVYTSGYEFVDTLKIARRKLKKGTDIENHSLSTLCEYYGIDQKVHHRALGDAEAAGILLKKLMRT